MKEITRIHIARNQYDIEVSAKKELEAYTKELEKYAGDDEILEDIEIRMTELLSERGVGKGGVITVADIAGLREQLGEPKDFAGDEAEMIEIADESNQGRRRLYRNTDTAMLGGVLGGIATYLGVNPLWSRLLFLVLLIGSFGTVFIVYIVMWLVIPPARTAAEKLELEGTPVTLASIRGMSERSEKLPKNESPTVLHRALLVLAGLASLGVTVGALMLTIFGVFVVFGHDTAAYVFPELRHGDRTVWAVLGLFVLSGLLLATLGVLLAYAAFARKFTKKIGVATVAIVLSGLLAFGSGVAIGAMVIHQENIAVQKSMKETKAKLPAEFASVKRLTASAYALRKSGSSMEMTVRYVVDPGEPRYIMQATDDVSPDIRVENGVARVAFKTSPKQNRAYLSSSFITPSLTMYGPALDHITVEQGNFEYISEDQTSQKRLQVNTLETTTVTLHGAYKQLMASGAGSVNAEMATVYDLVANTEAFGSVSAGMVRSLIVTQNEVCPVQQQEEGQQAQVSVSGVSSGNMTLNGREMSAATQKKPCARVIVGADEED